MTTKDTIAQTEPKLIEGLISQDALLWAYTRKVQTKANLPFTLKDHNYQLDLLQDKKRITNIKKGSQIGVTLVMQLGAIHGLIYKLYPQGVMYMMPSEKHVERFSKLRFTPMFDDNRWMRRYLLVNNVNEKVINGGSLIFVGARPQHIGGSSVKDSIALRTFECDWIIRDEIDMQDMEMVDVSKQRLNYSLIRKETNLSTPSFPGYGIDLLYENSDQRVWQIPCRVCGKHTCIEQTFPDCIVEKGGVWKRICMHCGSEIYPPDGHWETLYPDREEAGFWISGFQSPRADLKGYMHRYHTAEGNQLCEFMRSVMGVASIEAENQLGTLDIWARCRLEPNQLYSVGETVMGVDVGKVLHVVIGVRTARDTYEILNVSRCDTFEQLHDLANKMGVKYCVMDSMPDIHAARSFQKKEPYTVYLAQYSEQMPSQPNFDKKKGLVKCNRNEWCDRVHELFVKEKVSIPRRSREIDEYALEMTKTAKSVIENPDTGLRKPRWLKLGADHFFHSTLYFLLAASRMVARRRDKGERARPKKTKHSFYL